VLKLHLLLLLVGWVTAIASRHAHLKLKATTVVACVCCLSSVMVRRCFSAGTLYTDTCATQQQTQLPV
jgi:hypothetical protein